MNLLTDNVKSLYTKYLSAAFGSALITCIYGMVDMAMVGQYHGPNGTAALAVVAPMWNIIYSLGLLTGIGGSVIFSTKRGLGEHGDGTENQYFTASVIWAAILSAIAWAIVVVFEVPVLNFFGANDTVLPLALEYLHPILFVFPLYMFNEMLAAFLRNDGAPRLATLGVLSGGVFNIFGDWFLVFVCDMGAHGAGIATAIGSVISFVVMLTHFLSRKNTLRIVKVAAFAEKAREITVTGFSSFFADVAMGILTVLFNRQIMLYLGESALAIYGTVINISTFVQCCAYSIGQAAQPIISMNLGAGNISRVRSALRCSIATCAIFSAFWIALSMACPNLYTRIFMEPTQEILSMAPAIIRTYAISFLLLPFNIFAGYYFQAILRPREAFVGSVLRGLIISGILILTLPKVAGADSVWLAMPITELVTAIYNAICMRHDTIKLGNNL